MGKRGRASAAELAAVPTVTEIPKRPTPPRGMTLKDKAIWKKIVDGLPADYWRPSDMMLLEQLCRITGLIEKCDRKLKRDGQFLKSDRGNLSEHPAVKLRDTHVKTMVQLQKALRLCPSSRMQKTNAALRRKSVPKPWE